MAEKRLPHTARRVLAPFLQSLDAPGSGRYETVSLAGLAELAALLGISLREAMIRCLEDGVWPLRFKANRGLFSAVEQAALLRARVLVIGCGGLGGHVSQLLARTGVGGLALCDPDVFEESNLNRQLFCTEDSLGKSKALALQEGLRRLASHMDIHIFPEAANRENLPGMLHGADVLADCLDNIRTRRELEQAARRAGIPFVHGSIAGSEGFALLQLPGHPSVPLERLYGPADEAPEQGAETRLGVPATTAAALAVLQCLLVVRALLNTTPPASGTPPFLHLDLSVPEIERL